MKKDRKWKVTTTAETKDLSLPVRTRPRKERVADLFTKPNGHPYTKATRRKKEATKKKVIASLVNEALRAHGIFNTFAVAKDMSQPEPTPTGTKAVSILHVHEHMHGRGLKRHRRVHKAEIQEAKRHCVQLALPLFNVPTRKKRKVKQSEELELTY